MRLGMGSRLGWEQDGTRILVTWEWVGSKGSDSRERGIVDREHGEPEQGVMGTVTGQGVLDQLPQNLCQGLPVQPESLSLGCPKP